MKKLFLNLLVRNFLKNKLLNSLNILGLSMGLIAATLIIFYADHELSYDSFHTNAENIYRMEARTNSPLWFSNLGMEHGRELNSGKYPEVEAMVQLNGHPRAKLSYNGKTFFESNIYQVNTGASFFDFFDFNLLEGNKSTLLDQPRATVITKSIAEKYFGDDSPIGEAIKYDSLFLTITGVIEDIPSNSHLQFDFLYVNPSAFAPQHFHTTTYLKLVDRADPKVLEEKILAMEGIAANEFEEISEVNLVPIEDIYYESNAAFGAGGQGDKLQLLVFVIIGTLILFIAVANYINLSLAIYSGKGKEVGMRKVLGESKAQIIRAFFLESTSMTMLVIPVVILGLNFLLPIFNDFLGLAIQNKFYNSLYYWLVGVLFLILLSAFTVIYPAFTLTQIKVGTLLRSKASIHTTSGIKLRNVLIFLQFVLLFTLGISAWFMNRQVAFLDNKDMGFSPKQVIKITNAFDIGGMQNFNLLKTQLLTHPEISGVSFGPMMGDGMNPLAYKPEGHDEIYENLLSYGVDIDYFDVMGMEITAGDFKNVLLAAESGQVISLVNHNFINKYNWQNDPIGKKITLRPGNQNELLRKVSGVFKDFHFFSLKEKIAPQIISLTPEPGFVNTNVLIRSSTDDLAKTVKLMEAEWNKIRPDTPMNYDFMDDAVKRLYAKEKQTGQISVLFSMLAVLLSLLGLIGFMVYIISLKSKEIAIRKVLGATLIQIIGLLNRQLFLIIFFAAIIGSALSYWLVSTWLQDYAYSIVLSPLTFILAAAIVYVIVFAIISIQSFKSAFLNPTLALKNE